MSVFRSSRRRPPPPTLFPYTTLFRSHTFQTIAERQGRVIGGLSMGGYGAIKLALKFPQLFCSAVSHSAALDVRRRIERPEISAEMRRIFGPSPGGGPNDPYALAEKIDRKLLPVTELLACKDARLFAVSSCPWTLPSPFYKQR